MNFETQFNVAKSNADAILQSMSQTTNEGGSTYTKCEIALPSIDSGTAIVSDQSQHTGASGTQLPPTQIRLVFKNPKTNQKNNAENLEDANKKKRRLLLLNDFIGTYKSIIVIIYKSIIVILSLYTRL